MKPRRCLFTPQHHHSGKSSPSHSAIKISVFPRCNSETGEGGKTSITVVGQSCQRWGYTLTDCRLQSSGSFPVCSIRSTYATPDNHHLSSIWVLLRVSMAPIITEVSAPLPAEGKAISPSPPELAQTSDSRLKLIREQENLHSLEQQWKAAQSDLRDLHGSSSWAF